jgi:hypothetical protein
MSVVEHMTDDERARVLMEFFQRFFAGEVDGAGRPRSYLSVAEVAERLGKAPFTVREHCRLGRINAVKVQEKHGVSEAWRIPSEEVYRILDEGLLPVDPARNQGRRAGQRVKA